MRAETMAANPFELMMDPERVRQTIAKSESLSKLSQRQCHPLDRAVIRSASAELAAFDATIGIHPTAAEEFVTMREPVAHPAVAG